MKRFYMPVLACLAIAIAMPYCVSAKFPGVLQRYSLGYSFLFADGKYTGHDQFPGFIDTTYDQNIHTTAAFGVTMGTYIPLKRLGRMSSMVLSIDYAYNAMVWGDAVPRYGMGFTNQYDFSGATVQMALPVGIDFKWGNDAINVKNPRFCATVGVGAHPSYSITALDYTADITPSFSITPYVKFEAGVFAGICMKLRVLAAFGQFNYLDAKTDNGGGSSSSTKLVGSSNVSASIIFMPFSWTWKREEWYNTY